MNLIGVDVGRTNFRMALGNEKGKIKKIVIKKTDSKNFFKDLASGIKELGLKIDGIGIGMSWLLDERSDESMWEKARQDGLKGLNYLRKTLGIPVFIENDTAVAALGEATYGAGKGKNPVAFMIIGSGVGVAMVIDGKIFGGHQGLEGGHMILNPKGPKCACGSRGCLEAHVSGTAIKRRFGKSAEELKDKKAWDIVSKDLAQGLNNIVLMLSPQVIIVGGGVSHVADRFLPQAVKYAKGMVMQAVMPEVKLAKFGQEAGLVGALVLAANNLKEGSK